MSWFKVDDKFHAHPKIKMIPRRLRRASLGLWVIAGSWCADYETDGAVPEYMLEEFDADPEEVAALVEVGLWDDAEDGILFRNWAEFQPTRAQNDQRREADAERQRKNRQKHRKDSMTSGKSHGVTRTGVTSDTDRSHADVTSAPPETTGKSAARDPWDEPQNYGESPATSNNSHGVTPTGVTDLSRPSRTRPDPTPSTTPQPPEQTELLAVDASPRKRGSVTAAVYPDAFEQLWATWPKRRTDTAGKKAAHGSWERATRGTSRKAPRVEVEVLQSAVEAYAADPNLPPEEFQPNLTTWLNQDRWENGPLPPRGGGNGRPQAGDTHRAMQRSHSAANAYRALEDAGYYDQPPQITPINARRTA